jgi:hypothetical protein
MVSSLDSEQRGQAENILLLLPGMLFLVERHKHPSQFKEELNP